VCVLSTKLTVYTLFLKKETVGCQKAWVFNVMPRKRTAKMAQGCTRKYPDCDVQNLRIRLETVLFKVRKTRNSSSGRIKNLGYLKLKKALST
jgi:hypothetical protein